MAVVVSEEVKELAQLRREISTLKIENKAAMLTIDKLLADLNKKADEIEHLKSLVSQTVPVLVPPMSKREIENAPQEIADAQLERLRLASSNRTLTLEEVRMYDLLVKNKRLSQEKPAAPVSFRDVDDIELEKVARQALPKIHENTEE